MQYSTCVLVDMPLCGCFHNYGLTRTGPGEYQLELSIEGQVNLEDVLKGSGFTQSVSTELSWSGRTFTLSGVTHESQLRGLLELLSSVIFVNLYPPVEDCYALGPYTTFEDGERQQAALGNLIHRAKYQREQAAMMALRGKLETFVSQHPRLRHVDCIVAAPKSVASTPDLAGVWTQEIADTLGLRLLRARKTRQTGPQKELGETESEDASASRVANSVEVEPLQSGVSVLIIDDTIGSGGTIREVGRALREAGASRVFGLTAAKDARFARGGLNLSMERWQ